MKVEILQLVGSAIAGKCSFALTPIIHLRWLSGCQGGGRLQAGGSSGLWPSTTTQNHCPSPVFNGWGALKLRKWVSQWQKSPKSILTNFPEKTGSLSKALNRHYHQEIWNGEIANTCSLCAQNYFLAICILTTGVGQGALENGILKVAQC